MSNKDKGGGMHVEMIRISEISIPDSARDHSERSIKDLATSISDVGLMNPITVHRGAGVRDDERFTLVAGHGRLLAVKLLGRHSIAAVVQTGGRKRARRSEISENLFRDDLTVLEKSLQLVEYAALLDAKGGQVAQAGGRQPNDAGVSKAARGLGLSRKSFRRAKKIAKLPNQIRRQVMSLGLDNNQAKLLQIADADPAERFGLIKKLSARSKAPRARMGKRAPKRANEIEGRDLDRGNRNEDAGMEILRQHWLGSAGLRDTWQAAPAIVKVRFVENVLGLKVERFAAARSTNVPKRLGRR